MLQKKNFPSKILSNTSNINVPPFPKDTIPFPAKVLNNRLINYIHIYDIYIHTYYIYIYVLHIYIYVVGFIYNTEGKDAIFHFVGEGVTRPVIINDRRLKRPGY